MLAGGAILYLNKLENIVQQHNNSKTLAGWVAMLYLKATHIISKKLR